MSELDVSKIIEGILSNPSTKIVSKSNSQGLLFVFENTNDSEPNKETYSLSELIRYVVEELRIKTDYYTR